MQTVGIIGASGFVGSTLVESLLEADDYQVRPFIHSSGNAWRLARHGIELHPIDLMSPATLNEALQGCTHVVNCSRGPADVMIRGLSNLLTACRQTGIERFVHLSSVAVYAGPFPQQPIDESFSQYAQRASYGGNKREQDRLVEEAHRSGLPSVVLCPPNITGPYSTFLLNYLQNIRTGRLALVDGGAAPCVMVDVRNLVHGITLALQQGPADGRRIFLTDNEQITWRQLTDGVADLVEPAQPVATLSTTDALKITAAAPKPRKSFVRAMKHLVSGDVRDVLRRDPLICSAEDVAKTFAKSLPGKVQQRLRASATAGSSGNNGGAKPVAANFDTGLVQQQLRNVRYDGRRAREVLGYQPVVNFDESLQAFRNWYAAFFDWGTDAWELFQRLN